ncbi:hypothetical protein D3C87_917330 [compost metagenome]|jgi:hypothetical protein|uniref:Uncharacterized protein n=1 Tax=Pseudomonas germanica TaxID=2815720 RepID=A0ABX8YTK0_9PSED|nr:MULTISPECIES: hypothetical protein [Pseudomonas]QYY83315.1 hypothetical protein J0G10_07645 [Pseudomonas germanica]UVL36073.1 hypothetical protein LOY43_06510 [Pseudomonas sp. B21-041]WPN76018.1 hypothetical protein QMK46_06545 [Pseudomonas germanica]
MSNARQALAGLLAMGIAAAGDDLAIENEVPLSCIIAVDSGMTIFAKLKTVPDV